ncbi:hypothetical protein J1TS3_20990 [Siminovitchia fordii]|uniref:Uncharacterized protein n=1 Tax=Siminovitchia fordii TaxID=254759 RepID=A0ABQ4K5F4_9BACI|nr:hypothetical protein J1TS3_20990 [Siminovitchia fordii]
MSIVIEGEYNFFPTIILFIFIIKNWELAYDEASDEVFQGKQAFSAFTNRRP